MNDNNFNKLVTSIKQAGEIRKNLMKTLEYKGYIAKIEFDKEDQIFTGVVIGMDDIMCFHADDTDAIVTIFHDMVEGYLEVSLKRGIVPQISKLDCNSLMSVELKKAVQTYIPEYFSWDTKHQEEYRLHLPSDIDFKIDQFLYKELFGISVATPAAINDARDELSEADILTLNTTLLPLQGLGENIFHLNECLDFNVSLLDFETLYDYDIDDFNFQEKHRKERDKNYIKKPYRGSLNWAWGSLMIDACFFYVGLTMLAFHLYAELESYGSAYIRQLIPYNLAPGPNHDKYVGNDCYSWDMQLKANGLENELEELQARFRKENEKLYEFFIEEFDKKPEEQVYILDQSEAYHPQKHFLFSNHRVLHKIHFRTFMSDCLKLEQKDHSSIPKRLTSEKAKIKIFLDNQYKDIMKAQKTQS